MAFQVSPGVQVKEIDATNVVPAVSTSIGGFVGSFVWGPVNEVITVSSENELAGIFGTPDSTTSKHFLTAASFLKYGNALKVARADASDMKNATDGTALKIKNEDHYDQLEAAGSLTGTFVAKYPGALGNSLKVEICSSVAAFTNWTGGTGEPDPKNAFDAAPGTSDSASAAGASEDEIHVAIIDEDGLWSGTKGTILETFAFLSLSSQGKKSDGTTNYYKDVINRQSEYVWWSGHNSAFDSTDASGSGESAVPATSGAGEGFTSGEAFANSSSIQGVSLAGGVSANDGAHGDITTTFDVCFADSETVDVNLLFAYPDASAHNIANKLITICEARKDCMAFVSPPIASSANGGSVANVVTWANTLPSTSYASTDSSAVYVYDKYNDVNIYIGACGLLAGLCANTDNVADAWFSPAGVTRGQLLGVIKLALNPKKADRDTLYKARVNPLVSFPGQGTMLFGDKTLLSKPSAFDRINVRRLFIVIEKAISTAAKGQLFEFNDEFTRAQFRNLLEPFLRDVKGRRGVTDFKVVCDETNNTGQVIDANRFVADIFIKPSRSINFISLNFIATRTGVDFTEIAGV